MLVRIWSLYLKKQSYKNYITNIDFYKLLILDISLEVRPRSILLRRPDCLLVGAGSPTRRQSGGQSVNLEVASSNTANDTLFKHVYPLSSIDYSTI